MDLPANVKKRKKNGEKMKANIAIFGAIMMIALALFATPVMAASTGNVQLSNQIGVGNSAYQSIHGSNNYQEITQVGTGFFGLGLNSGSQIITGNKNIQGITQVGVLNAGFQKTIAGNKNIQGITQVGVLNAGFQKIIAGNKNGQGINQVGTGNHEDQIVR
jgi:hypothetical protein